MLSLLEYHPIETQRMRDAAQLWAELRISGKPGAHEHGIGCDVILIAHARHYLDHLIVTDNEKHFTGLCNCISRAAFLASRGAP
jgi:predicted nucleic acid-binding protein